MDSKDALKETWRPGGDVAGAAGWLLEEGMKTAGIAQLIILAPVTAALGVDRGERAGRLGGARIWQPSAAQSGCATHIR